jgi:site-specific recombinase XerD
MASIKIVLNNNKVLSDGTNPIIIQIIKDRKKRVVYTGFSSNKSEWNSKSNSPNKKHPNYAQLKLYLKKKLVDAETCLMELESSGKPYSIDELVLKIKGEKRTENVFQFWEDVINELERTGKIGNSKAYINTLSMFKKFRKEKDLTFNELNYTLVKKFDSYMLEQGLQVNGISFHMRTLRALYNRAVKDGGASKENYPFEKYKIKREKTIHRALTKEEVKRIRDLDFEDFYMKFAQDLFMFSFYTRGMSFIDIAYLQVKNIHNDRLQYRRSKTGQMFTIKLTTEAMEIVEKYSDLSKKDSYLFPIVQHEEKKFTEYKNAMRLTNKKLKDIGELAECSIPVTTYVARHSWATIAKRGGISTTVISEGLGHATEHITQVYLDGFENSVLDDANDLITNLD